MKLHTKRDIYKIHSVLENSDEIYLKSFPFISFNGIPKGGISTLHEVGLSVILLYIHLNFLSCCK